MDPELLAILVVLCMKRLGVTEFQVTEDDLNFDAALIVDPSDSGDLVTIRYTSVGDLACPRVH